MDELTELRMRKWHQACKGNSQRATIARHLLMSGEAITQLEALNLYGCMRLAPRICELKEKSDLPICSIMVERAYKGKRKQYARYYIASANDLQMFREYLNNL